MDATATATPARIEVRDGRRWWLCPCCGQRLGELHGDRVVIAVGDRRVTMPARNEPEQTCPKCGAASVVGGTT